MQANAELRQANAELSEALSAVQNARQTVQTRLRQMRRPAEELRGLQNMLADPVAAFPGKFHQLINLS